MLVNVKMFFVLICFANFKTSTWSKRENSIDKLIVNVNLLVDIGTAVNSLSGNGSIRFLLFWFLAIILLSLFTGRLFAV